MSSAPHVRDLLLRWDELRRRGESASAEQLCADHPELVMELQQRIQVLEAGAAPSAPSADTPTASTATLPPDGEGRAPGLDFLDPPQEPDEIGRLGRYRVVRKLGAGSMGLVFEAIDPRLGRRIALKVMQPQRALDAAARQRFLREARALAAVSHDQIVPVYEADEAGGVLYLVMPLLRGEPLDARLRRQGPLPGAEVLRIGREAAEGLAAAHAHGLVHRDVKPSNLWLEELPAVTGTDGPRYRAKLLDFGLVRMTGGEATASEPGMIVGTAAYMAPEQARGETVDGRADLFSLGCVLYHTCTGRPPFGANDYVATLAAVATQRPPAPVAVNPAVPQALSDLIMRLLAKDPAGRPATAQVVSAALHEMAHGGEVAQRLSAIETVDYPGPRTARRTVRGVAAVVVLLAVLAVALGALASRWIGSEALTVRSLRVWHTLVEGEHRIGRSELGVDTFATRFGDQVRVTAELSEPAYCFLLAFNPDGKEQLCLPPDPQTAPERLAQLTFPPEAGDVFDLNDGTGLQAFVLVASRQPLPAYEEWLRVRPPLAWRTVPIRTQGVWRGDGRQPLSWQLPGDPDKRGTVSQEVDLNPLEELCRQLRATPGVEVVGVVAFPVLK